MRKIKIFFINEGGSATIEMSVIMGILIMVIYFLILIFLYVLDMAAIRTCTMNKVVKAGDCFANFEEEWLKKEIETELNEGLLLCQIENVTFQEQGDDIKATVVASVNYEILRDGKITVIIRTRKNQREKMLRRWQLFGA